MPHQNQRQPVWLADLLSARLLLFVCVRVQLHLDRMFLEVHEEMAARDLRVLHVKTLLTDAYFFRHVAAA